MSIDLGDRIIWTGHLTPYGEGITPVLAGVGIVTGHWRHPATGTAGFLVDDGTNRVGRYPVAPMAAACRILAAVCRRCARPRDAHHPECAARRPGYAGPAHYRWLPAATDDGRSGWALYRRSEVIGFVERVNPRDGRSHVWLPYAAGPLASSPLLSLDSARSAVERHHGIPVQPSAGLRAIGISRVGAGSLWRSPRRRALSANS